MVESLAIYRELGNKLGVATAVSNLGFISEAVSNWEAARLHYEESLAIERELGNRLGIADTLNNLGDLMTSLGDYGSARTFCHESLTVQCDLGNMTGVASGIESFGWLSSATGETVRAAWLLGAAEALRETMSITQQGHNDQARHDRAVAACRAALGERTFDAAWERGRAMTLDEAVALALGADGDEA